MEKRIAVIGIILENTLAVEQVNVLLSKFGDVIVGRMGIPYRERGMSVISIIADADADKISALTGSLGKIDGVSVKAAISKAK